MPCFQLLPVLTWYWPYHVMSCVANLIVIMKVVESPQYSRSWSTYDDDVGLDEIKFLSSEPSDAPIAQFQRSGHHHDHLKNMHHFFCAANELESQQNKFYKIIPTASWKGSSYSDTGWKGGIWESGNIFILSFLFSTLYYQNY